MRFLHRYWQLQGIPTPIVFQNRHELPKLQDFGKGNLLLLSMLYLIQQTETTSDNTGKANIALLSLSLPGAQTTTQTDTGKANLSLNSLVIPQQTTDTEVDTGNASLALLSLIYVAAQSTTPPGDNAKGGISLLSLIV